MIISASYKTDIPAFYGEWFSHRLKAGYCMMRNPLNRRPIRVSLETADVDGIVFWTKNFRPFLKYVDEVVRIDYPFVVQYTINGYPKSLETNVVDWRKSVETTHMLAKRFGPRAVVWRYDTIIFTEETSNQFHVKNFAQIAAALSGSVDEVVISFLQLYQKSRRNLGLMQGNVWQGDPELIQKRELAALLSSEAAKYGITLTICSQPEVSTGQPSARCIDVERLSDVAKRPLTATVLGNRPGCECSKSRDIGDYDTCPHGCVYCYAVRNNKTAISRFRSHCVESEYLFEDVKGLSATNGQKSLEF